MNRFRGFVIFINKFITIDPMKRYRCTVCGHVYDPAEGEPDGGIFPGTPFENIPDSWVCPICGVSKSEYVQDEV